MAFYSMLNPSIHAQGQAGLIKDKPDSGSHPVRVWIVGRLDRGHEVTVACWLPTGAVVRQKKGGPKIENLR